MGDLNDDPTDRSVQRLVKETVKFEGLYNPMEALHQKGVGSIAHQDRWHLFDQLISLPQTLKQRAPYNSQGQACLEDRF